MKLIVARHGLTEWNKEGRMQGHTDTGLSSEGREQAKKLALRLKGRHIEVIFSSPLKRALETAREIQRLHKGAELVIDNDLKELDLGIFEGLTWEESKAKHPDMVLAREKSGLEFKGHGGESLSEFEARTHRALQRAVAQGKDCVIVSHGGSNRAITRKLLGMSLEETRPHFKNNTSVSIFDVVDGKATVEVLDCSKHLSG